MATFEDPHDSAVESGPISPPGLTTGRRRESSVWDYFVFDASRGKSICQVEATDGTHKCGTGIAGKFPTNLGWFSMSPLPRLHHHDIMTIVGLFTYRQYIA